MLLGWSYRFDFLNKRVTNFAFIHIVHPRHIDSPFNRISCGQKPPLNLHLYSTNSICILPFTTPQTWKQSSFSSVLPFLSCYKAPQNKSRKFLIDHILLTCIRLNKSLCNLYVSSERFWVRKVPQNMTLLSLTSMFIIFSSSTSPNHFCLDNCYFLFFRISL